MWCLNWEACGHNCCKLMILVPLLNECHDNELLFYSHKYILHTILSNKTESSHFIYETVKLPGKIKEFLSSLLNSLTISPFCFRRNLGKREQFESLWRAVNQMPLAFQRERKGTRVGKWLNKKAMVFSAFLRLIAVNENLPLAFCLASVMNYRRI